MFRFEIKRCRGIFFQDAGELPYVFKKNVVATCTLRCGAAFSNECFYRSFYLQLLLMSRSYISRAFITAKLRALAVCHNDSFSAISLKPNGKRFPFFLQLDHFQKLFYQNTTGFNSCYFHEGHELLLFALLVFLEFECLRLWFSLLRSLLSFFVDWF